MPRYRSQGLRREAGALIARAVGLRQADYLRPLLSLSKKDLRGARTEALTGHGDGERVLSICGAVS